VRKLKEFNNALLGKWCWRMLVDTCGLWYRVLVARYGELGRRLEVGSRSVSSWLREVGRIRDRGGGDGSSWFTENVSMKVGDGFDTLFWYDRWIGGVPLCERYSRLFDLSENKTIIVVNLFSVSSDHWGDVWRWRRRLWAWEEEMVAECRALLLDVSLYPNISDRWVWLQDPPAGYTDRGAYDLLTTQETPMVEPATELVWHNQVPLKVSVFAWRLVLDRLPTKSNLVARGVLSSDMASCIAGCGLFETSQHLFLSCATFGSI